VPGKYACLLQCPGWRFRERVRAALILRARTRIESTAIGFIKRLDISHITTYCSKIKIKHLIWRYFSVKYVWKSYTNRHFLFVWHKKKRLLFETRRPAMTLCVERWGEGADLWRQQDTSVTWLYRTTVIGWRVLLISSFRLIRLNYYHWLWSCFRSPGCLDAETQVHILKLAVHGINFLEFWGFTYFLLFIKLFAISLYY